MKPEFSALDNAIKLVKKFCDFGLMRKFASLMNGIELLNGDGLKPLGNQYQIAYNAVEEADQEGLRISQQANELTQQFYLNRLEDFDNTAPFKDYSPEFLKNAIDSYNIHYPDKAIDYTALVIYKMYLDSLVNTLKRICGFYKQHLERTLRSHTSHIQSISPNKEKKPQTKIEKIKIRLTIQQILYFFELLQHSRIIEEKTTKYIADFISANFYNEESKNFSSKYIQNSATNEASKIDSQIVKAYLKKMIKKIDDEYK